MRQNNRLSVVVFFYADSEVKKLHSLSAGYLNLSVFGPTTAIINGTLGKWFFDQSELKNKEKCDNFWDAEGEKFLLGDFNYLVEFLVGNSGRSSEIEVSINED